MDISDAKRLKGLEDENGKLNKLIAEQMLDNSTLKEMLKKSSDAWFPEKTRGLVLRKSSAIM